MVKAKKKEIKKISRISNIINQRKQKIRERKESKKAEKVKEEISKIEDQRKKDSSHLNDKNLPHVTQGFSFEKIKHQGLSKKDKKKLKKSGDTSFLIHMLFSNGTSKEFVICTQQEIFMYKKRSYFLNYTDSWFNLTQNQYELYYFDDYAVPINRAIKKDGDKRFFSVTPENLKPLFNMQYIKVLASSQELDRYLRMCAMLCLVLVLMGLGYFYYFLKIVKMMKGV